MEDKYRLNKRTSPPHNDLVWKANKLFSLIWSGMEEQGGGCCGRLLTVAHSLPLPHCLSSEQQLLFTSLSHLSFASRDFSSPFRQIYLISYILWRGFLTFIHSLYHFFLCLFVFISLQPIYFSFFHIYGLYELFSQCFSHLTPIKVPTHSHTHCSHSPQHTPSYWPSYYHTGRDISYLIPAYR